MNSGSFEQKFAAATNPSSYTPAASRTAAPLPANPQNRPARQQAQRPAKAGRPSAIMASPAQAGNPLLKELSNCVVSQEPMAEDFHLSDTCCALYLSVKYHKLHPEYIGKRMEAVKQKVKTLVLVVHVDDADCEKPLLDIQSLAFVFKFVVVLAWSLQESARYLEAYAKYSMTNAVDIKLLEGKQASDSGAKMIEVLTTVPSINKTDAKMLMRNFDNLADIFSAQLGDLSILSGFGDKKLEEFHQATNTPFLRKE